MESINICQWRSIQKDYTTNSECLLNMNTATGAYKTVAVGRRTTSGSPLLQSGLIAWDGLCCIDASTVAIHTLEIRVAQRSKGRYPPGGVEGKELLQNREAQPFLLNKCVSGAPKSWYGWRKHHKFGCVCY